MKTFITTILLVFLLQGCRSGDNLSKEETASLMNEKITSSRYTFVAQTAIPLSGRSINLDNSYSLRVSKDTIESYLPYFGRAYTAPISTSADGGIKFVSTDFDYSVSDKKKGMWDISIETKDVPVRYKLFLKIGDSGYGTLIVQETNRQSISFYGKIE
ncbi:DUF4251 domain-containing protein [Dysgonomonas sp.]